MMTKNAQVLDQELNWFCQLLDTRIKLYFGHECQYKDIDEIPPPSVEENGSMYGNFVQHYRLSLSERAVFLLGLIPYVKPQILDVFFTKNKINGREFTEFGGRNGNSYNGFLPTGETALFILAGEDLEKRLDFSRLFDAEHFFARHHILWLEHQNGNSPEYNGFLTVSKEILDLVTTGQVRKPNFSMEFPAKLIETGLDWDDLILDSYTMSQVMEIKAWIDYGNVLLNDLGLGKKIKPGFRSLFFGPPGTGKTFTASLLGKVTERDVYRIDLSMVVSKYIGETEKNLEKVFKRAEHQDWILFFDEADALFGKRTKIHDAHDRYANQEVSYLLQRVEDYAGVVILASNKKSNLDEAFTRRFQSIIYFPMPKPEERLLIWKQGFSDKIQFGKTVNPRKVAYDFELSGGSIMNVVRYATLMAVKNQSPIEEEDILKGIHKELQKEGKTV